jgi:hypothetical protein
VDETDRLIAALDLDAVRSENRRRESLEYREAAAILRALRLAPTIELGEAILRGEKVPTSALDPEWAKAYGLSS